MMLSVSYLVKATVELGTIIGRSLVGLRAVIFVRNLSKMLLNIVLY